MAIYCANLRALPVFYRKTTALNLFLVLVLKQIFFCFLYWMFICQQQNVPPSVIVALGNENSEEANSN
jgi:hypothetical protein